MKSEIKAINRLTDFKSEVSCHYFIKKNGSIILMVPEKYIAWHAGLSQWKNFKFLNKYSLGIELQNSGHKFNYPNFKSKQINSLMKLCKYLKNKFNISPKNILGHSDIAYERKKDPGKKFPWNILAKKKLTIWHNINSNKLKKLRSRKITKNQKKNFFKNLNKIGYKVYNKRKHSSLLIKAFQSKYRNELINGSIDLECLFISKKISEI